MHLSKLHIENFRNIQTYKIKFSEGLNLITGMNGQGKSNLLEAIYFLGNLKSFRGAKRSNLTQWGCNKFGLRGEFISSEKGKKLSLEAVYDRGKAQYRINGVTTESVENYLSRVCTIAFHPDSLSVLKGGPIHRRMFIDRGIFHEKKEHLHALKEYNRVLAERRWILKNRKDSILGVWTEKLIQLGIKVAIKRRDYCQRLNERVLTMESPPGGDEPPQIKYLPSIPGLKDGPDANDEKKTRESFLKRLEETKEEEQRRGQTLTGPHRDDLTVWIGGRDLSRFGSQGQQKAALLSLITAQSDLVSQCGTGTPIMIFDDVTSELDGLRVEWVCHALASRGNQVFISSVEAVPIQKITGLTKALLVRRGEMVEVESAA